jgi:hypothetical protein
LAIIGKDFYTGKTGDFYGDAEKKKVISDWWQDAFSVRSGVSGKEYRVILPHGRVDFLLSQMQQAL